MTKRKDPKDHKKAGRPANPINMEFVDNMLKAGCEGASIARMMGVHPSTLYDNVVKMFPQYPNFSAYAKDKRAEGLDMLRAKQFDVAMKGDKTMLVWLGKNHLNQSDKIENKHDLSADITVKFGE